MPDIVVALNRYIVENIAYKSKWLKRDVVLDAYLPNNIQNTDDLILLLVNDGQDLPKMPFAPIIDELLSKGKIEPVLTIGIYCNEERQMEYGTADLPDYLGRGNKAHLHRLFVLKELIPFIRKKYLIRKFKEIAFAGFSLGGLSAMDIVWASPKIFKKLGAFSASFWWRSRALDNGYVEETDRIMHQLIKQRKYYRAQQFFFQTGTLDETADRNNNGVIDSIDDTLDIIADLKAKGYKTKDIEYLELANGCHDVPTWAIAFPYFLLWGWGLK